MFTKMIKKVIITIAIMTFSFYGLDFLPSLIPVVKFNNGVKTIEPIRNGMEYVQQVYNCVWQNKSAELCK